MATESHKAGQQASREMLARRYYGNGHVPRPDGVHTIAATAQSFLQRVRPSEPELHGLPIAVPIPAPSVLNDNLVQLVVSSASLLKRLYGVARFFS